MNNYFIQIEVNNLFVNTKASNYMLLNYAVDISEKRTKYYDVVSEKENFKYISRKQILRT